MEQLTIGTEAGSITTYYRTNSDGSIYSIDFDRNFISLSRLSEYIFFHSDLIAED